MDQDPKPIKWKRVDEAALAHYLDLYLPSDYTLTKIQSFQNKFPELSKFPPGFISTLLANLDLTALNQNPFSIIRYSAVYDRKIAQQLIIIRRSDPRARVPDREAYLEAIINLGMLKSCLRDQITHASNGCEEYESHLSLLIDQINERETSEIPEISGEVNAHLIEQID